jgi:hypothetical protein
VFKRLNGTSTENYEGHLRDDTAYFRKIILAKGDPNRVVSFVE